MNIPDPITPSAPKGFRRVAPAFVLFFMSPYVAEYLLGNLSIGAIAGLLFVAPLYGGGAVVIREIARRGGRGWPTIILLALAYGLLEEGLSLQTLFNPHYLGLHLLEQAYLPALGIGGWWTVYVLTLHTVWSISVPIALTEALFADRRETPWLGTLGLAIATLIFVVGLVLNHAVTGHQEKFAASTQQLSWVAGVILLVVILAFRVGRPSVPREGVVPKPALLGALTFLLGLAHMRGHLLAQGWPLVALLAAGLLISALLMHSWSGRSSWTPLHVLAAAGGAMLSYACLAFPQEPSFGPKGAIDLAGNIFFGALAIVLLAAATRREKNRSRAARAEAHVVSAV